MVRFYIFVIRKFKPRKILHSGEINKMDGDLQKELVWVLGTLVAFIIFLLVGGINELSEIAISTAAFLLSWSIMSLTIKRFGANVDSGKEIENEMKWFTGILMIFLTVMTIIGKTDDDGKQVLTDGKRTYIHTATDISGEDADVRAIANAAWTDANKNAAKASFEAANPAEDRKSVV